MFKVGDLVIAKPEFLDPKETLLDTAGIVAEYNPDNDYLGVGVLNPEDYVLPPIFSGRGSCYEVVPIGSPLSYEIEAYELKKKREKIQKVLSKKHEEINTIDYQIRNIEAKKFIKELEEQGIKESTFFVGFAKHLDYHCQLLILIKVERVSPVGRLIHCVKSEYRIDDGDYSLKVTKSKYTKRCFANLVENFEIIQTNASVCDELFVHLVNLEVTTENLENIKKCIKEDKKIFIK